MISSPRTCRLRRVTTQSTSKDTKGLHDHGNDRDSDKRYRSEVRKDEVISMMILMRFYSSVTSH